MKKTDFKKILLVFDERLKTATMSQILLLNKYQVLHAKDKREAMTIAKKSKPDLIIFDSQNKLTDGDELLRSVRSVPATRRIPFLFVMESPVKASVEGGADQFVQFLARPHTREELAVAVQNSLKRS